MYCRLEGEDWIATFEVAGERKREEERGGEGEGWRILEERRGKERGEGKGKKRKGKERKKKKWSSWIRCNFSGLATIRCVAASRTASRTRRSWTTCCCRPVTTSGFYPRSKVHWGPRPTPAKTTTPLTTSYPMTLIIQSTSNTTGTATTIQHHTTTAHCSPLVKRVLYIRNRPEKSYEASYIYIYIHIYI